MVSALRLSAFSGIVDHEGIEERQLAKQLVGGAIGGQCQTLPREPLERPVSTPLNHCIRAPYIRYPAIERRIVMARWHVRIVIHRLLVEPEASRRLNRDGHIPECCRAEQVVVV